MRSFSSHSRQPVWNALNGALKYLGLVVFRRDRREETELNLSYLVNDLLPREGLILVGGSGDGGYWMPSPIPSVEVILSLGLGGHWAWDTEMSSHLVNVKVVGVDPEYQINYPFEQITNAVGASRYGEEKVTIESLLSGNNNNFILKIDVEGDEYISLIETPSAVLGRCQVLVVELHELNRLLDPVWRRLIFEPFQQQILSLFDPVMTRSNPGEIHFTINGFRIAKSVELTLVRKKTLG